MISKAAGESSSRLLSYEQHMNPVGRSWIEPSPTQIDDSVVLF